MQTAYARYIQSDAMYVNTSFIRLKNVALFWSLPQALISKMKLQSARVYFQGQNLFTITNYKGLDPETASVGVASSGYKLPPLRMLTAGIQLSL